jgi:3alpha(or 20beta)-hydroxysteroid dehydrogenase
LSALYQHTRGPRGVGDKKMGQVAEKVAIVTGGARGQGAAHARTLAAAGASVMITDILEGEGHAVAAEIGARARFMRHDVTDEDGWQAVVAETLKAFGRIDILVNNAGVVAFNTTQETTRDQFERVFQINVVGAFLGLQAVHKHMQGVGGGSVINIASIAAVKGTKGMVAYGVSKWGMRGLTRYAAQDYARDHIRVNAILPGVIDTPMTHNEAPPGKLEKVMATIPWGRMGSADEVAELVLFLASDASQFITGAEIAIDGGATA